MKSFAALAVISLLSLTSCASSQPRNGREAASDKANLKRVCFRLQVKKDRLEEYKTIHKQVWPEMLKALRETGWTNYSLFLGDDGLLIGYLETEDFERAKSGMGATKVNSEWQTMMAPFFENTGGSKADASLVLLSEAFHLD